MTQMNQMTARLTCSRRFAARRRPCRDRRGFALVVTISLMVLLTLVAVGLLGLSSIALRATGQAEAMAVARSNARLSLLLAIGELQQSMGDDRNISAPSEILDARPETTDPDGINHPRLTGVWQARNDPLPTPPDYQRDTRFRQWLVSNSDREALGKLDFATGGTLQDPVRMAAPPAGVGGTAAGSMVHAGKVPVGQGAYAWWVGDENCKALVNRRDLLDRETNPRIADLIASFATPGAHGMRALDGHANFPTNTDTTDKLITRDTLALVGAQAAPQSAALFHDLSPYPESVLANVTAGGLRKDLNLYLERKDLNWLEGWGKAEGKTAFPRGPLGPNGKIALSPPNEYDVLGWKSLHHW